VSSDDRRRDNQRGASDHRTMEGQPTGNSEGFDESTASQLRNAVLSRAADQNAGAMLSLELSDRLQLLPAFQDFQLSLGNQMLDALSARLMATH